MIAVVDALGRRVELSRPARRVVSLVPSETHSVAVLRGPDAIVGRTRYCVEPPLAAPVVGGTKDVDVDAVAALRPDLVLANKEENSRRGVEALIAAGLPVHVSFPCGVREAVEYLGVLERLLGTSGGHRRRLSALVEDLATRPGAGVRTFVPIWVDPWMTFDGRTFASDLLELCGGVNVFADRPRRYPLAADLGRRPPLAASRVGDRDTRYPRVTLEEVLGRAPELALLPDEPYAFGPSEAAALVGAGIPAERVRFVSGKDLFWYGGWMLEGLPRLAAILDEARRG